jgi:hypothetical protein
MSKKTIIFLIASIVAVAGAVYYFFFKDETTAAAEPIRPPGAGSVFTGDTILLPSTYDDFAKGALKLGYYVPDVADTKGQDIPWILHWIYYLMYWDPTKWAVPLKDDMTLLAEAAAWQRALQIKPTDGRAYTWNNTTNTWVLKKLV